MNKIIIILIKAIMILAILFIARIDYEIGTDMIADFKGTMQCVAVLSLVMTQAILYLIAICILFLPFNK